MANSNKSLRVTHDMAIDLYNQFQKLRDTADCDGITCSDCPMHTPSGCAIVKAVELFESTNAVRNETVDTQPTEPGEVAPAEKGAPKPKYGGIAQLNLDRLRKAFSLMCDMTDDERTDPGDNYLECSGVKCEDCPMFTPDEHCVIPRIRDILSETIGASDPDL